MAKAGAVVAARRAAESASERKVRDMVKAPGRGLRSKKRNESAAKWDRGITRGILVTNVLLPNWDPVWLRNGHLPSPALFLQIFLCFQGCSAS